ncbi:tRNA 2-thiouridine(34) synthase MnmA [Edaphobacter dinghuensis]|uniref:tRNA-specific 2-thiouridylase MnmA n=1 Tax=Edaphobacter dinghuensis TaxID=1560005 RepID=A0A917HL27_9BACT|nr:tRNA 2-thiouridine(34) synthase MnmA [Edaphobacter dinghuensis]GGG82542.1 tRNA-specific 2-thiouridylase MnmA [Edaphobacter dinghuensis]
MPEQQTIAVAMSGGVDSSAVAALLRSQGYTLVGLTLQLWNQRRLSGHEGMPEAVQGRCCSIDDVYDARHVAEQLDIPYYVVNQQDRFEADVVKPFVSEYLAGRTPIPCTLCNNHLKFDQLLTTARQIGADRIATGHYARNRFDEARQRWILSRPADHSKDQTYFLFGLTQEQLSRTLFPLGEMQKPAVREMASEAGLNVATKPDSQEICFIPGGDYNAFLKAYLDEQGEDLPDSAGELVSSSGEVIGHHQGIQSFTVGQRKGLGLTSADPLYVLAIHPDSHRVTVGSNDELMSTNLRANRINWISIPELTEDIRVTIKVRHRHTPAAATLSPGPDGTVTAIFDEPQRAITPGQAAVFYQEDEVVGGGWIF